MLEPILTIQAPAKVNLLLNIHSGVDKKGYHVLDSVFAVLDLCDSVEFYQDAHVKNSSNDAQQVFCCVPDLGIDPAQNLAYRAYEGMAQIGHRGMEYRVVLRKMIPSQAGLGGGSSDAAAVIIGLSKLWNLNLADRAIIDFSARLGADVAFFVHLASARVTNPKLNAALMTGYGEIPEGFYALERREVLLVKPKGGVSTPAAYKAFDHLPRIDVDVEGFIAQLEAQGSAGLERYVTNNLFDSAVSVNKEIADVVDFLESSGDVCGHVLLCGSGACVMAFLEDDFTSSPKADELLERLHNKGWWAKTSILG